MKDDPRKITYGAMMIALFAILLAVLLYIPPVGIFTMYLVPLPIILYRLRYDRIASILVTLTGIVLSMLFGGLALLSFAFVFGLAGFMIAEMIRMGKSKLYTFMAIGLMYMITAMIMYVAAVLLFNFNFIDKVFTAMQETKDQFTSFMGKYGAVPDNFSEMTESMFMFYEHSVPSAFILTSFVIAFLTVTPNLFIARRLGNEVPKFPPFREMKLPIITVIVYGVILLLTYTVTMEPGTNIYLICLNATIILRTLFLLQGISFIHHYLYKMKLPNVVTFVATLFALLFYPVTALLGILDSGVNIRAWIGKDKAK